MAHQVLQAWHLGTGEKKDYTIDLNSELNTGETVTAAELFVEPNDGQLTLENMTVASGVVLFWASTPAKATAYWITARGTLSNQRQVENTIVLAGIEKAHGDSVLTWP